MMCLNIPNFLTLSRLFVSPFILPFLISHYSAAHEYHPWLAILFLGFGLTDWFDGYLARKCKQESMVGKIIDPLADKLLIFSVLIALLFIHKIHYFWVILLLSREFFIIALRHVALEFNFSIPVSFLAKIKTAVQMCWLTVLIFLPVIGGLSYFYLIQNFLFISTIGLTIYTGLQYAKLFYDSFNVLPLKK